MVDSVTRIVNASSGRNSAERGAQRVDTPPVSATILVVDDESALLSAVSVVLRTHGYTVLEAKNGSDALTLCQQCSSTIELLLADIVLTGTTGPQVAARLMALRPTMKVLYMSGQPVNAMLASAVHASGARLLQKPIIPDVLIRHVRELLGTALDV